MYVYIYKERERERETPPKGKNIYTPYSTIAANRSHLHHPLFSMYLKPALSYYTAFIYLKLNLGFFSECKKGNKNQEPHEKREICLSHLLLRC